MNIDEGKGNWDSTWDFVNYGILLKLGDICIKNFHLWGGVLSLLLLQHHMSGVVNLDF